MSKTAKKEEKTKREKKPIVFDLSDGVTWHDFIGIFVLFFVFLWRLLRLILAPVFWVYGENVRMYRFIRASSFERPMSDDERKFVESIPFILSLTGMVGGVLVGVFAALSLSKDIEDFFEKFNFDFLGDFGSILGDAIAAIFGTIFWAVRGIGSGLGWTFDLIKDAFSGNAFLAFMGLAGAGLIVLLLFVALSEKGIFGKFFGSIIRILKWVIGSPERFRFRMDNYYRKLNHWLTTKLVGELTLLTRSQVYFKRVVFITLAASLYSFIAGVYIGVTQAEDLGEDWKVVLFIAGVLFVAGILSGSIFFGLIARFLDLLNRKKYISPEFKSDEGEIDKDKMKSRKEKDASERDAAKEEYEKTMAKMADKPWKKREAKGKKKESKPKTPEKKLADKPKEDPKS